MTIASKLFFLSFFFFKNFLRWQLTICGATGILYFGLRLTPPMGFKARVDAPLPDLDVTWT